MATADSAGTGPVRSGFPVVGGCHGIRRQAVHRAVAATGCRDDGQQVAGSVAKRDPDGDRGRRRVHAGQFRRDPAGDGVRSQQGSTGGILPYRGDDQYHSGRRQGPDPRAADGQWDGTQDHDRGVDLFLPDARQHGPRAGGGQPAIDGTDARAVGEQE